MIASREGCRAVRQREGRAVRHLEGMEENQEVEGPYSGSLPLISLAPNRTCFYVVGLRAALSPRQVPSSERDGERVSERERESEIDPPHPSFPLHPSLTACQLRFKRTV